jgi:hypothetical protein
MKYNISEKQIITRYALDLCICCGKEDCENRGSLLCRKCNKKYMSCWNRYKSYDKMKENIQWKACTKFHDIVGIPGLWRLEKHMIKV